MIDPKIVREKAEIIREMLINRRSAIDFDSIIAADKARRGIQVNADELRAIKNSCAEQYGRMKRTGTADSPEGSALMEKMKSADEDLKLLETRQGQAEEAWMDILLRIPNVPHESVPVGGPDTNHQVRTGGVRREFGFKPKSHWEIAEALGLIDFARAAKIAGARFTLFTGAGARLERALIQFMLDLHTGKHGYTEMAPPILLSPASMLATGQLPVLDEDMYKTREPDGMYLNPTAEVPLANIHREEILDGNRLPIKYVAYLPSFRREAGTYGKETRGLIRQHQFDKVELFQFVKPEDTLTALEEMSGHASAVLDALGLYYRVMLLATGDMSQASMKTYDPEVWMPGMNSFVEIASWSTCGDYQARRGQIRFRREAKSKAELVHTLNGSGLAVGRTFAAVLENNQQEDGSVTIPEVLRPYMGGQETLKHA
jgi:seryl-tRNA synthetase